MAELKTKENDASVDAFISSVDNEQKRKDCRTLVKMFEEVSKEPAKMWGPSIIGFGKFHYKSKRSSQEGDWMVTGFSPRKANLTLYFMDGYDKYQDLLAKLGKFKTSVSCLYVKKLSDIDLDVLRELMARSYKNVSSPDFAANYGQ